LADIVLSATVADFVSLLHMLNGLPLAVAFGVESETLGFDIDKERVRELKQGVDRTLEVEGDELTAATKLSFTSAAEDMASCNIFIVTVPTPVTAAKQPDLFPLRSASEMISSVLKRGDIVIYESTVFPGATEEVCVPILEQAEFIDQLYASIIVAGTHLASSIKVAEAAKVIENTQRDVNIALVNELALIFNRLDIDTSEVLAAAGTKWNFLPFTPGLVGGHCIGVDPYYLTHKADEIGYHSRVILSGREINDGMGQYVAEQVIKLMTMKRIHVVGSRILVLGFAFKENCPDMRNTRVIDIVETLRAYNAEVDIHDPWIDSQQAREEYDLSMIDKPSADTYDAVILAVAHQQIVDAGIDTLLGYARAESVIYDVKSVLPADRVDGRL